MVRSLQAITRMHVNPAASVTVRYCRLGAIRNKTARTKHRFPSRLYSQPLLAVTVDGPMRSPIDLPTVNNIDHNYAENGMKGIKTTLKGHGSGYFGDVAAV